MTTQVISSWNPFTYLLIVSLLFVTQSSALLNQFRFIEGYGGNVKEKISLSILYLFLIHKLYVLGFTVHIFLVRDFLFTVFWEKKIKLREKKYQSISWHVPNSFLKQFFLLKINCLLFFVKNRATLVQWD